MIDEKVENEFGNEHDDSDTGRVKKINDIL